MNTVSLGAARFLRPYFLLLSEDTFQAVRIDKQVACALIKYHKQLLKSEADEWERYLQEQASTALIYAYAEDATIRAIQSEELRLDDIEQFFNDTIISYLEELTAQSLVRELLNNKKQ